VKYNIYSVFDSKMASYGQLWCETRDAAAIRKFQDAVNENTPNNAWYKHPEDYSLFSLGVFDDDLGNIQKFDAPINLVTASALKEAK